MNTLIVTGGKINKNFLKKHLNLNKYDIIIAVDKGLESLDYLEIKPNYIVGDFDSIDKQILKNYETSDIEITKLIPEKDFTDTESALQLAKNIHSKSITIIGGIGTRIDHTIANVHILKEMIENDINAKIINENNEIILVDKNITIEKDKKYKYISLIPLTTEVQGLTLKGFKYNVENYTLKIGTSLGISNEQIEQTAKIELDKGIVIMIKSKD